MGKTIAIPLTKDKFALIDEEDYEIINQYTWTCDGEGDSHHPYIATTFNGKGKTRVAMHRLLLDFPGYPIRHKNGDCLDNRRENIERRGDFVIKEIPNAIELSYMAGILDGEGCISASGKRPFVTLSVTNTYPELVDKFLVFGGNVSQRKTNNTAHRAAYTWSLTGIAVKQALEILLPYMFIKQEQAKLAIQLCDLQIDKTFEGLQTRTLLAEQLRNENHRIHEYIFEGKVWG